MKWQDFIFCIKLLSKQILKFLGRPLAFAWPDGAPGDAHWIVANKPEKNTCSSMDPSLSGTHNGGKQDGGVPFQLTTNKRNGNKNVAF